MATIYPTFAQGVASIERVLTHLDAAVAAAEAVDPLATGLARFRGTERAARKAVHAELQAARVDLWTGVNEMQPQTQFLTENYAGFQARLATSPFAAEIKHLRLVNDVIGSAQSAKNIAHVASLASRQTIESATSSSLQQIREMARLIESPDVSQAMLRDELAQLAHQRSFTAADVTRARMIDMLPAGRRPSELVPYDAVFADFAVPEAVQGWLRHSYPVHELQGITSARAGASTPWTQLVLPFG